MSITGQRLHAENPAHVGGAWAFAAQKVRPLSRLVIMNVPHPAIFARTVRRSPRQMLRSWYMLFFQLPGLPEWATTRRDALAVRRAMNAAVRR